MIEILGWGSPIGLGSFLVCLGIFVWLASKADLLQKKKSK